VAEIWETSGTRKGKFDGKEYTALEIARERNKTESVSVLERFVANPALTRQEIQEKHNFTGLLLLFLFISFLLRLFLFFCE